ALRAVVAGRRPVETPAASAGGGVDLDVVGEGKDVDRIQRRRERLGVARRLGEAVVEVAAPGAGDIDDERVEDLAAILVGVEALPHEVAEEAPGPRDAH